MISQKRSRYIFRLTQEIMSEDAQTLVEYAFIVFVIVIACVALLTLIGQNVLALFQNMANVL
jgi:Flp pilus assembly pilin Flp